jgi:hypothetical protein
MGATHRLTDGGGIIGIIRVALTLWRDARGPDQAHVMAQLAPRARPIVCALAGFHTDTTGGERRRKGHKLGACQFLANHDGPLGINPMSWKHVLSQSNPEDGYLHDWTPPLGLSGAMSHTVARACAFKTGESIPLLRGAISPGYPAGAGQPVSLLRYVVAAHRRSSSCRVDCRIISCDPMRDGCPPAPSHHCRKRMRARAPTLFS